MNCSASTNPKTGFTVWLTGLPASGKSTIAKHLQAALRARGIHAVLLDSDPLRGVLTPRPTYSETERDRFYSAIVGLAEMLAGQGTPVLIAATGHRRRYRQTARETLPCFLEVFVDCPLEVCANRDPKGLYARAGDKQISGLPGVDRAYEPPEHPELVIDTEREPVDRAAARIIEALADRGWLA